MNRFLSSWYLMSTRSNQSTPSSDRRVRCPDVLAVPVAVADNENGRGSRGWKDTGELVEEPVMPWL